MHARPFILKIFAAAAALLFCLSAGAAGQAAAGNSPAEWKTLGTLSYTLSDNALQVQSRRIGLKIDSRLAVKPALRENGGALSPVSGEAAPPVFGARVEGFEVEDFAVDWDRLNIKEISDQLGRGACLELSARSKRYGMRNLQFEAQVRLSFYEKFPDVVIFSAGLKNLSGQNVKIEQLAGSRYLLDRRLLDPGSRPWEFASYQGAAYNWSRDYSVVRIGQDTDQKNFMGLEDLADSEGEGGGTPLIDLWAPEMGLALACAEASPQWISLPVRTLADGRVEIALTEEPKEYLGQKTVLAPGESCATVRSALILHHLDFYDPLHTYADLLRAQAVQIPLSSPPESYEPYWKSWGFKLIFNLEQIYGVLPELKKIGIKWANPDDGWFTWYGDWKPNPAPGKFPGGESDMRKFVSRLHSQGFKTSPWWYPQGVSPESDLAREHPDWLLLDRQGKPAVSSRDLYIICPEYQPGVDYVVSLVDKFMGDWGYDGLYLDCTDLSTAPPCFNPAHHHKSPLDSYTLQYRLFEAIYKRAQEIKPGCPVEMCICGIPHDPFKMAYYNVANASDPLSSLQMRRRIKVEKAFRGPTFCVGDCYQVPAGEWYGNAIQEDFESAMGSGAQVTTFFADLSPQQMEKWKRWFGLYRQMGLSSGEYLNLYDLAFDIPEAHLVRKNGKLYYGFFADNWSTGRPLELRGLDRDKSYRVRDWVNGVELGTVQGSKPLVHQAFKVHLLLEATPITN